MPKNEPEYIVTRFWPLSILNEIVAESAVSPVYPAYYLPTVRQLRAQFD